ncbi:MAG: ABC transporter permease [Acidimicrobiales bacterium]
MTTLTGLPALVRLVLRRDRVRLPVWIVALVGFIGASAASLPPLYPDQESIDNYVRLFGDNPALVAFAGPGHGFDDPNLGVILVNETQLFACIGIALMSIFLVNRHTRAEEDAERTEVLRSSVVGRHAPTAAAVTVVGAANLVVGALCGVVFVALGYSATGSVALAGSLAMVGLVFTAITALAAQAASGSRSTLGLASVVLGVSFVLRALGDIGENGLVWLSPIGWAQAVQAYAGERWWTLGLCGVVAAGLVVSAFWLSTRRDLGSGILPQRPGPPRAREAVQRPLGLAVRLQRGSVIGWTAGLAVAGMLYGSIGEDVEEMIADNPEFADFLAQAEGVDLIDSFFATSMSMLGLLAAGFAISSVLRLRAEESAGRVEPILSSPVSRPRWAMSHVTVAVLGSVVLLVAGGAGVGIAYSLVSGETDRILPLVGAALTTLPAVLVLASVGLVLFGLAPGKATWTWGALAVAVLVSFLGDLLRLPSWSRHVSPFHHLPQLPAEDLRVLPLVALVIVAVVLGAVGIVGLRSRDLRTD